MNSNSPFVTVLLPAYNAEKYLIQSIDSILNQTYSNFEFLVINDGSSDSTEDIILSYTDSRIRYVKNDMNCRLIANLNRGIEMANGKYIVRMDADDISMPTRISEQVEFMENNEEFAVAGSWVEEIPSEKKINFETNPSKLKLLMLFSCRINHPSVIMRTSFLKENNLKYNSQALHAEDYALWLDIYRSGGKIGMVPSYLLQYRTHENNIGVKHADIQKLATYNYRKENLQQFVEKFDERTYRLFNHFLSVTNNEYFRFYDESLFKEEEDFVLLSDFLLQLITANFVKKIIEPTDVLSQFMAQKWLIFCQENSAVGYHAYSSFFGKNFQRYISYSRKERLRFWLHALFKKSL